MTIVGTRMVREDKTARQLFEEVMANPARNFTSGAAIPAMPARPPLPRAN